MQQLEQELGVADTDRRPKVVAELVAYTLRLMRLGLSRHARRAGVVLALAARDRVLPGGRTIALDESERMESIGDALVEWYLLASGIRWQDLSAAPFGKSTLSRCWLAWSCPPIWRACPTASGNNCAKRRGHHSCQRPKGSQPRL
jgi:hypothetical protein